MEEWVKAAERIKGEYGTQKALCYLIGEKFYNVVEMVYASWKMMRIIEERRGKPDYDSEYDINLDDTYEKEKKKIPEVKEALTKFSVLIKNSFSQYEIKEYFKSHPRLGAFGHTCTEEEQKFLIEHDAVEHSVDTEVKDAMIFDDMIRHLMS
jgi:hypothetical protein